MGDVSTGDNPKLKTNTRKYSVQIREYANVSLTEPELNTYLALYDEIRDKHHMTSPEDLMMLDLVCFDFIRIKRLHNWIREWGDVVNIETKSGNQYTKANEASYLLNAVQSQFRQNMKELLLTRKETTKKAIATGDIDFANWINAKMVEGKVEDE